MKRFLFLVLGTLMLSGLGGYAQSLSFSLESDTAQIEIGEAVQIELSATVKANESYDWPALPDTITGLVIAESSGIDTVKSTQAWLELSQKFRVTSFDSGFVLIPPLSLFQANDSAQSERLVITVNFPDLSEEQEYYDIKEPLTVARNWWLIAAAVAGALALLVLAWWLWQRFQPSAAGPTKAKVPPMAPHLWALQELSLLQEEKLWQNDQHKTYYSRLIDILRVYLERRFGVKAMESTAAELKEKLKSLPEQKNQDQFLGATLNRSALVKYAKEKPLPVECEQDLAAIVSFVKNSRPKTAENDELELSV